MGLFSDNLGQAILPPPADKDILTGSFKISYMKSISYLFPSAAARTCDRSHFAPIVLQYRLGAHRPNVFLQKTFIKESHA